MKTASTLRGVLFLVGMGFALTGYKNAVIAGIVLMAIATFVPFPLWLTPGTSPATAEQIEAVKKHIDAATAELENEFRNAGKAQEKVYEAGRAGLYEMEKDLRKERQEKINRDAETGRTGIHILKTETPYFQNVLDGLKKFEVRQNDRDFRTGDILILNEWEKGRSCDPPGNYTGRKVWVTVKFILDDPRFVFPGYVVMSIEVMKSEDAPPKIHSFA